LVKVLQRRHREAVAFFLVDFAKKNATAWRWRIRMEIDKKPYCYADPTGAVDRDHLSAKTYLHCYFSMKLYAQAIILLFY